MSALSRALLLSFVVALPLDAACADDGASLGGFICVRPFSPVCAEQPDTYRMKETLSACRREVDGFAAATAAYRDCLERQISSAVRHANDVLDRFRCLSQHSDGCGPQAFRP